MGFRSWVIARDRVFYDALERAVANAVETSGALLNLFDHYEGLVEHRQRLKDLEHKGDQITHTLFQQLGRSHLQLPDRLDIGSLAKSLDDVVDHAFAACNRLFLYEITKPTVEMRKFAELIGAQTRELQAAVAGLRSRDMLSATLQHCIEVNRIENDADRLLNDTLAALFRGADPIHILKHKEIYELLETATDKCEDVADVLSDVARKRQK